MPSAFDPPDVQVGVEPDIFLSKASLPADCFQPIHYLFHQNLITPLPFQMQISAIMHSIFTTHL